MISAPVSGQGTSQEASWRVQSFTTADGLPSTRVHQILQDSRGFLWIATAGGLVQYDGYTFTTHLPRPGDSTSINNTSIWGLFEPSSEDGLWIGAFGGLSYLDHRTGHFASPVLTGDVDVLNRDAAVAFHESPQGTLWIRTWNENVCRIELESRFATCLPADKRFTASASDANGLIWLGTPDTLYSLDPTSGDMSAAAAIGVSALAAGQGSIWVGSSEGLYRMDPDSGILSLIIADLPVSALTSRRNEKLLVISNSAILEIDPATRSVVPLFQFEEWLDVYNFGSHVYEDKFGIIWSGGYETGLVKLDQTIQPFTTLFGEAGQSTPRNSNFRGVYEDREGYAWSSSTNRRLQRLDRRTGRVDVYNGVDAFEAEVTGLYEDRAGSIWMSTCGDGLKSLDRETRRFSHYTPYPPARTAAQSFMNCINPVIEDGAGRLWVPTFGGGLLRLDTKNGQFYYLRHDPEDSHSIASDLVIVVYEDRDGAIWAGHQIGISRYNAETATFTNYTGNGFQAMAIHEDREGRFWVATGASGLIQFDRSTGDLKTFSTDHGLAHNAVRSIVEDENGVLWLGTENGLSRFDPFAGSFRNFYIRDGLPSNVFKEGGRHRSATGELFFGTSSGVVAFFPERIVSNNEPPRVRITRVRAGSGPNASADIATTENEIRLPHDRADVTFEYVGLHFLNPSENRYAYTLEGFDLDWTDAGVERAARYLRLPPGKYVFRVRASSSGGVWSEEEASIQLAILPPWWRTWWAYAMYVLLFSAGVFAVDRFQRRRIIRRERVRARERELEQAKEIEKAYDELKRTKDRLVQQEKLASLGALTAGIAHEIKNPLNFVNNFASLSKELTDELDDELEAGRTKDDIRPIINDLRMNVAKIEEHGRRADGIVRSMLEHSRGTKGERQPTDINALVEEYVNLAYHGMRAQTSDFSVTIARDYDSAAGKVQVVPQEIGRVFLNLLNNAFQAVHERAARFDDEYAPRVDVGTRRLENAVEIRVGDNGPGIPQDIRERIFEPFFTTKPTGSGTGLGLSLSFDIVTQGHGGTIRVESTEGECTAFIVGLPA